MRAKVSAKKIGFKMGPAVAYIPAQTTTTEARTTSTRAIEAGCRCCAVSGCLVSRFAFLAGCNFYLLVSVDLSFPRGGHRCRRPVLLLCGPKEGEQRQNRDVDPD